MNSSRDAQGKRREEDDDVEFVGMGWPRREEGKNEEDDIELVSIEIPIKRKEGIEEDDDVELVSVEVQMEGRRIEEGQSSYSVALEEARRATSHFPFHTVATNDDPLGAPPPYENLAPSTPSPPRTPPTPPRQ